MKHTSTTPLVPLLHCSCPVLIRVNVCGHSSSVLSMGHVSCCFLRRRRRFMALAPLYSILYTRLSPQQRQWHWQQAASDEWEVFSGRNTEPAFPSSLPINILGYATWILIRRRTDGGWRSLVVVGVHRRLMLLLAGHFFHYHVLLFDPHWLSDWLTLCCCGCCCSSVLTRPNHCHSFAYSWTLEFFRVSSTISIAQIAVVLCVCLSLESRIFGWSRAA